ncbi:MAG TPA: hypothetical protein DEO65_04505 [Bacillus bacterium]|uniref:hypothetical protein n=1 Tax=Siminovitchia fordii TaxID=254759 RepID=UPI00036F5B37|nr:hypothetical protein [Siminovitchia fordii]HBZ09137.1 hypothetical protein [Bacillus sp. (in: firmicutes)]
MDLDIFKKLKESFDNIINLQEMFKTNVQLKEAFKLEFDLNDSESLIDALNLKNLSMWSTQFPHISMKQYFQQIDALKTLRKNPKLFSQSLTYSGFLNSVSKNINDGLIDNLEEEIENVEEIKTETEYGIETALDEINLKHPALLNIAFKINIIISSTDNELEQKEINDEELNNWKRVTRPILLIISQLFLAWAFSSTSIKEMNIYKSIEGIFNQLETIEIDNDEDFIIASKKEK